MCDRLPLDIRRRDMLEQIKWSSALAKIGPMPARGCHNRCCSARRLRSVSRSGMALDLRRPEELEVSLLGATRLHGNDRCQYLSNLLLQRRSLVLTGYSSKHRLSNQHRRRRRCPRQAKGRHVHPAIRPAYARLPCDSSLDL
jgi:hypothetical protein